MKDQQEKILRDVLNNLYDPEILRRSPLAEILGVADRNDTPSVMQRILINEIQALKPHPGSASYSQNRRSYDLLQFRYIEQFSQKEVAEHMGVSLRQYQREQQKALELLTSALVEKYHWTPEPNQTESASEIETETEDNLLENDNSWLFVPSEDKSCELEPILQDVVSLIQPLITRHKAEIDRNLPANLPVLSVHPVALRQILVNLLNAAIHETACGKVTIYATQEKWEVVLEVKAERCASSSRPVAESNASSVKIATQLAKLSGGTLMVSRELESFDARLTLPARETLPILVIDDSLDNIKLLQRYLTGTRYRMVTLADSEMALETVEKIQPGLIVLDLMMPKVDGWDLLGRLRNHIPTLHIPVLIFSILPQEELALSLGADAFLRKPVSREKFLSVLDHYVLSSEQGSG